MKFITLSNQRSGSSFFQRLLNSHPDILARQEDLRKIREEKRVVEIMDSIYGREKDFTAVGFKVQYNQVRDGLMQYLIANDVKIIHLIRRNFLETALWFRDHFIGKKEGGLGMGIKVPGPVEVKIESVTKYLRWLEENTKKYKDMADLTVYYEAMTGDEDTREYKDKEVRAEVLKFLGVVDRNLFVDVRENNKPKRQPSKELVKNWEDLMEAIKRENLITYYED